MAIKKNIIDFLTADSERFAMCIIEEIHAEIYKLLFHIYKTNYVCLCACEYVLTSAYR